MRIVLKANNLPRIRAGITDGLSRVVRKAAQDIVAHAQTEMAKPKSGRVYRRGRRVHVASAPGEAPAIDNGALVNSFRVMQEVPTRAIVGVTAEHGVFTEEGTSRMQPRPYMRPAAESVWPEFERAVREVVRRAR